MSFVKYLLVLALAVHVIAVFPNGHQRHRNSKHQKRFLYPNSRFRWFTTKSEYNADNSENPETSFETVRFTREDNERNKYVQELKDGVKLGELRVGNAKTVSKPRAPPVYLFIDQAEFIPRAKGVFCDFEPINEGTNELCLWTWNTTRTKPKLGFRVATAANVAALNDVTISGNRSRFTGPLTDADRNPEGHFLYLPVDGKMEPMVIMSPKFQGLKEFCKFEVMLHQAAMRDGSIKLLAQSADTLIQWVLLDITGNNLQQWRSLQFQIGKVQQDIYIMIEVTRPSYVSEFMHMPHIAFDNIKMIDCQPEPAVFEGSCRNEQLKCVINNKTSCVKLQHTCDLVIDCDDGKDENLNCDKMPYGSYCNFEQDDCGFRNIPQSILTWKRHTGPTPTAMTGPNYDHTCGDPQATLDESPVSLTPEYMFKDTCVGYYFFVNMNVTGPNNEKADFATTATLSSQVFNPPPKVHGNATSRYYNCCMIRFYYQQNGKNFGSLGVDVIEITNAGNMSSPVWFSTKDKGENWLRATIFLPNVTNRYFIEFWTRMGMRIYSDAAIDDFSLSPECFGLNIPKKELGDYSYYDLMPEEDKNTEPHPAFADKPYYKFNACGATGRHGPNQTMCDAAYQNTNTTVTVLDTQPQAGIQVWQVPAEGLYTIIAHGAAGGYGSSWTGISRGAQVRSLFKLHKGEKVYILIGQKGFDACKKTLSGQGYKACELIKTTNSKQKFASKMQEVRNTEVNDGGGGGGGGTFVYIMEKGNKPYPLLIAGGGGGISLGVFRDDGLQHGMGLTNSTPQSGLMFGNPGQPAAGAGGGWKPRAALATSEATLPVMGKSLAEGGTGGQACVGPAHGGFGGGGGGCLRGGGGGGWTGGNANQGDGLHGSGGWSYRDTVRTIEEFTAVNISPKDGSGEVIIVPALHDCKCDYRCVALDETRSNIQCYCPLTWLSDARYPTKCILPLLSNHTNDVSAKASIPLMITLSATLLTCMGALLSVSVYLYGSYRRKRDAARRSKQQESDQDMQLLCLRPGRRAGDRQEMASNPYYGSETFIASNGINFDKLPKISRARLSLVRALGQGAFGEVYEGVYRQGVGANSMMAVAVKTLPEVTTTQSEIDFMMEAAIMTKFKHPNIVHLMGVCFERHPSESTPDFPTTPEAASLTKFAYIIRYKKLIVLELLGGGDLKSFLRDSRPRVDRPALVTITDLLKCSQDIANGCRYMETKRFIHRDIAARNCLLTTLEAGRVAKIADFGLARDIYRADYYRKNGKSMLPIKWMPPESFVDGIYSIKTDVWSFAVLMWEVFTLGVMPYPGCSNRQVIILVNRGGRLATPYGCPKKIYKLMCDCWNPNPMERPSFAQIYTRITKFMQDPEILNAPMPALETLQPTDVIEDDDGEPSRPCNNYLVLLPPLPEPVPPPSPRQLIPDAEVSPPPEFRSTDKMTVVGSNHPPPVHEVMPPVPEARPPTPAAPVDSPSQTPGVSTPSSTPATYGSGSSQWDTSHTDSDGGSMSNRHQNTDSDDISLPTTRQQNTESDVVSLPTTRQQNTDSDGGSSRPGKETPPQPDKNKQVCFSVNVTGYSNVCLTSSLCANDGEQRAATPNSQPTSSTGTSATAQQRPGEPEPPYMATPPTLSISD